MASGSASEGIEIVGADGMPSRHALGAPPLLIGRSNQAEIRLPASNVSRRHAELAREDDGAWCLRDLESHNGTYVNGAAVEEAPVAAGDEIAIGDFTLRLLTADELTGETTALGRGGETGSTADTGSVSSLTQLDPPHVATAHLATLSSFGERLLEIEREDDRLAELCELMVGDAFEARAAMVLRLDEAGGTERPKVRTPLRLGQGASEREVHVSRTLLAAVEERDEPVIATNVQARPGGGRQALELSLSSAALPMAAIAAPIQRGPDSLELLYAVFPPAYATGEWLALVQLAVRQYRQAELAWAGRRRAEQLAAVTHELEQARELQLGLVPHQQRVAGLDAGIGFEPCHWVGGDYADVVPLSDGRVLVTVADVCGKGMRAALTTSSIYTMVHASVRAGLSLADLMSGLNEHLLETLADHHFVTMLAVAIDPATGALACVNAGHLPGLIVEPDGSLRRLPTAENMPLGVSSGALAWSDAELEPGAWLALYSDGLSELPLPEGGMLGIRGVGQRVRDACARAPAEDGAAKGVADELLRQVHAIQGERTAADDYTVVIARRRP